MEHFLVCHEVERAEKEVARSLLVLATFVRDLLCIEELFSNPGWSRCEYIEITIFLLVVKYCFSLVLSLNLILPHKIIIITIQVEIQLELLVKSELIRYGSFAEIFFIFKVDAFCDEILSDHQMVEQTPYFRLILTIGDELVVTSDDFERHGRSILNVTK